MATRCCSPPDKLRRVAAGLVGHLEGFQQFFGAFAALLLADAGDGLRQLDVVAYAQIWHEVAAGGLPNEPDLAAAIGHQVLVGNVQQVAFADTDTAGRRAFESREDIQEGGLAGTAGADDTDQLAGPDLEIDAAQGDHFQVSRFVDLEKVVGLDVCRSGLILVVGVLPRLGRRSHRDGASAVIGCGTRGRWFRVSSLHRRGRGRAVGGHRGFGDCLDTRRRGIRHRHSFLNGVGHGRLVVQPGTALRRHKLPGVVVHGTILR